MPSIDNKSKIKSRGNSNDPFTPDRTTVNLPLDRRGINTLDRFIPHSTSQKAYKASSYLNKFSYEDTKPLEDSSRTPQRLSSPEFFTDLERTNHYSSLPSEEYNPRVYDSLSNGSQRSTRIRKTKKYKKLKQSKTHRKNIANSLNLTSNTSVLQFSESKNISQQNDFKNQMSKLQNSNEFHKNEQDLQYYKDISSGHNRKATRSKSVMPFRVLDARALRNDFYTNLIDWSLTTNKVLIGLGASVYMWSERSGAIPVMKHNILADRNDFVTCVSFSPYNGAIVIGSKNGSIFLYDQKICIEHYSKYNGLAAMQPLYELKKDTSKGIACIKWYNQNHQCFIVGAESGEIYIVDVIDPLTDKINMQIVSQFQAQSQQVCGLSINKDDTIVAVGGNDNCCTLWDISCSTAPILKYILKHSAAVKAVAFCPWSKSLLATGGGSKDKTLKFWHSPTGTLIKEYKTSSQITSLIWSVNYRQLVVTFGFGDVDNPLVLTVYTYPDLREILYVKTPTPLRVLSAAHSPDCSSICVAMNDETIRFYEIWHGSSDIINEYHDKGVYGSDIIEFMEGIHNSYRKKIR